VLIIFSGKPENIKEVVMFLEQTLDELVSTIHEMKCKLDKIESNFSTEANADDAEFITIKQIGEHKDWPYSDSATRKLISRGRLMEGVHYFKVEGKIICKWSACRSYLSKNFAGHLRSA
jgi:hypothetical protein